MTRIEILLPESVLEVSTLAGEWVVIERHPRAEMAAILSGVDLPAEAEDEIVEYLLRRMRGFQIGWWHNIGADWPVAATAEFCAFAAGVLHRYVGTHVVPQYQALSLDD